jgi:hypothetical protein
MVPCHGLGRRPGRCVQRRTRPRVDEESEEIGTTYIQVKEKQEGVGGGDFLSEWIVMGRSTPDVGHRPLPIFLPCFLSFSCSSDICAGN